MLHLIIVMDLVLILLKEIYISQIINSRTHSSPPVFRSLVRVLTFYMHDATFFVSFLTILFIGPCLNENCLAVPAIFGPKDQLNVLKKWNCTTVVTPQSLVLFVNFCIIFF